MWLFMEDVKKFYENIMTECANNETSISLLSERDRCACGISLIRVIHFTNGINRDKNAHTVCALYTVGSIGCNESDIREI